MQHHVGLPIEGGFSTVRGLSFNDTAGLVVKCYQLCRDGRAHAIADFMGGKLSRFISAESCRNLATKWLAELERAQ